VRFLDRIPAYQQRTESALSRWLERSGPAVRLHEAMCYSALGGGKRIRPLLVFACAETLGLEPARLEGAAAAVELIHAYSLAHDDLPAMDDDDLRRGRPTCHRAFDEATAILAGDALQVRALQIIAEDPAMEADAEARLWMVRFLTNAAGLFGMAGGQMLDLAAEGHELSMTELEQVHRLKTGALIEASVMLPAALKSDLGEPLRTALSTFGAKIGLAFQIQDDILDVEGSTTVIGKTQGADAARAKPTYATVLGLDGAREQAKTLHGEAVMALAPFGSEASPLQQMADLIVGREH
jgi:geranylgeranyl pyrophosphate synthase